MNTMGPQLIARRSAALGHNAYLSRTLASLLGAVALVGTGCEPVSGTAATVPVAQRPAGKWNIILISVDTLRADRLGCYGYRRDTTPSIDQFASRGVRFEHAISESPWTAPSHMTLFTGLYPTTHGVTSPGVRVCKNIATLPEMLKENGYRTFAFTGGGNVGRSYGFARGFERYEVTGKAKSGYKTCAMDKAIAMAQDQIASLDHNEPYFVFLHGYDVHEPYEPWEPWASRFKSPDAEPFDDYLREGIEFKNNGRRLSEGNIKFLSDLYDAGIGRMDHLLDAFFDFLERRGELERSIVVLLSDHGEEFGEHGWVGHLESIYPECLRIPLIIVGPGIAPRVVKQGVGLKDVMPTLLELVGIQPPPTHGCSLVPYMRGERPDPRPLFSETDFGVHLRSVIWDNHQLIRRAYDPTPKLFDLVSDPNATLNIATAEPKRTAELMSIMPDPPSNQPRQDATAEVDLDALRSLGYVGSPD